MEDRVYEKIGLAQRKIKLIKGFYYHLIVFIAINAILLLSKNNMATALLGDKAALYPEAMNWMYWNIAVWGIGVLFHALFVFGKVPSFIKKWEERQIKKYMNDNS